MIKYIGLSNVEEKFFRERLDEFANGEDEVYIIGRPFPYKMIMETGIRIAICEEYDPDFNLYDYALGVSDITYGDRYLRISRGMRKQVVKDKVIDYLTMIMKKPYTEAFCRNRSFWGGMYEKKMKRMYGIFFWERGK